MQLTYYKPYLTDNATTAILLSTGNGNCVAFSNFFMDVLKAQGLGSGRLTVLTPIETTTSRRLLLLIKGWEFTTAAPLTREFDLPFYVNVRSYTDANPTGNYILRNPTGGTYEWFTGAQVPQVTRSVRVGANLAGQGNIDPQAIFYNHVLVRIGTTYFDPSYGASYTSIADFQNRAVAGYAKQEDVLLTRAQLGLAGDPAVLESVHALIIFRGLSPQIRIDES